MLAVSGVALLVLTLDPVWSVLLLLAACASGLGGWRSWWPVAVAGVAVLGWLGALVLFVADADADRLRSGALLGWAVPGLAICVAVGISFLVRQRVQHEQSEVDRAVAHAQDIAVHDPLTGLTNRRGLALLGAQILESAHRRGDAVYCVFVDIDGLARVNDELGHSAGDDVLLTVAEGLRRSSRATDAVARWGNDQFVVVGPGTGLAPMEMERRIRAHCVEHGSIDRRVWPARVSAGGSVLEPWDDGTIDSLLRLADREMHLRRALRREAGAAAYGQTRIEQGPRPRHPGVGPG